MCVDGDFGKDTLSGNVGKDPIKETSFRPAVSSGGCSTSGWEVKRPTFSLCSLPSGADLTKAFPLSVSQVAHLGLEYPKSLSFFAKS